MFLYNNNSYRSQTQIIMHTSNPSLQQWPLTIGHVLASVQHQRQSILMTQTLWSVLMTALQLLVVAMMNMIMRILIGLLQRRKKDC